MPPHNRDVQIGHREKEDPTSPPRGKTVKEEVPSSIEKAHERLLHYLCGGEGGAEGATQCGVPSGVHEFRHRAGLGPRAP